MAHAALAALALAVCAGAEQYGGGAMPQYGAADYEQDYQARSLDAPAPLDYKYQEESQGDSEKPAKFTGEVDRWRKMSGRVQRRPALDDTEEELELEGQALELEARRGRRRRKHRGRGRRDESRHEQPPAPRRRPPLAPHADRLARPDSHHDQYSDSIDYRDNGNKYLEDNERIPSRETTVKLIGRKPRQKIFAPPPPGSTPAKNVEDLIVDEVEEKMVRPMKDEIKDESDYLSDEERDIQARTGRNRPAPMGRLRPTLPNADFALRNEPGSQNEDEMPWGLPKPAENYPEYKDYHSMKKIENISNKLPTLLRRPTTTTTQRARRLFSAGRVRPWPGRRAGELAVIPLKDLSVQDSIGPALEPPTAPSTVPTSETAEPATEAQAPSRTTPTPAAPSATPPATTAGSGYGASVTYSPVAFVPTVNMSELSMADKSRLSIMKKAQMKENARKSATRKPPVLLQVTMSRVPTVVLVAQEAGDPWQRAREVAGDSPSALDKVKRLMRQKLVSRAKSIRDLTDNWDETVCDYIDVGMLETIPDSAPCPPAPLHLLACASLCLLLLL